MFCQSHWFYLFQSYSQTGGHRYGVPGVDPDYLGLVQIHLEPTSGHPPVHNSNASSQLGDSISCVWQLAVNIQLSIIHVHVYVDTRPSQQLCPRVQLCTTQTARDPRLSLAGLNMLDTQRQTWRNRMWWSRFDPVNMIETSQVPCQLLQTDAATLQLMHFLMGWCFISLPYLQGGQVVTPAQRWGRISSAQCAAPM